MLEDLVLTAVREAIAKSQEAASKQLGRIDRWDKDSGIDVIKSKIKRQNSKLKLPDKEIKLIRTSSTTEAVSKLIQELNKLPGIGPKAPSASPIIFSRANETENQCSGRGHSSGKAKD